MDYYSILDNNPQAGLEPAPPNLAPADLVPADIGPGDIAPANLTRPGPGTKAGAVPVTREPLRFPGEDGGKSLSEMAKRDLDATLQLLAERAQYITGASGAAIALREGGSMVCCASSGPSAPEVGAHLQIDSGLSAESVRTRQTLWCDDAENDPRVNRESCRIFGIASVVVMPLVKGDDVYGVFELLSGRPRAFEERDFVALNRLAGMIQTAVELAEAARRPEKDLAPPGIAILTAAETGTSEVAGDSASDLEASPERSAPETATAIKTEAETKSRTAAEAQNRDAAPALALGPVETSVLVKSTDELQAETDLSAPISTIAFGNLRRCETCGFPVSEGRRLCLDCEAATPDAVASIDQTQEMFGEFPESNTSWIRSHVYLIATALIAVATIALLAWRL